VLLGALPVPIIWNLKMKLRVRLYVIGILNLGYLYVSLWSFALLPVRLLTTGATPPCSAVLMGILKAVFMLTTGGDPDAIFNYWVHFWEK
jgi:hypothetical protein